MLWERPSPQFPGQLAVTRSTGGHEVPAQQGVLALALFQVPCWRIEASCPGLAPAPTWGAPAPQSALFSPTFVWPGTTETLFLHPQLRARCEELKLDWSTLSLEKLRKEKQALRSQISEKQRHCLELQVGPGQGQAGAPWDRPSRSTACGEVAGPGVAHSKPADALRPEVRSQGRKHGGERSLGSLAVHCLALKGQGVHLTAQPEPCGWLCPGRVSQVTQGIPVTAPSGFL